MVGKRRRIRSVTVEMGPLGLQNVYDLMIGKNIINPISEKTIFTFRKTKGRRSRKRTEGF